uniref:NADH-ubiquinone oxidoreductase chain 2 n=1 Tax=Rhynchactis macrothrix TaxID=412649 RepID=D3KS64_RHYMR|nr:NADH dehydrogenase subunit 2 [Rhynchactis macrothrix]BAI77301.1 NADH dehydrogenase subunit 2 [Rhynchactis macrothrix]
MAPIILSTLLLAVGLGTTNTFASSRWLLAWMGIEINTLAILPLMARQHHPWAVEAATKYFLAQATAAAVLLFASVTNAWLAGQWDVQQMSHPIPTTMVIIALALKLGVAPLHTWLPEVLQGLDIPTGLILSTWQKLAPIALILQLPPTNPTIFILLGLWSTFTGGWGGLNQTQLRKVLAYSSVAHLGWMFLVLPYSPYLTVLTLLAYISMTTSAFLVLMLTNATTIKELAIAWPLTPGLAYSTPLILLSLGGLPPLTGFMPKWLILQELTKQDLAIPAAIAAFSALLSLYFYLRLCYTMVMTNIPNILLCKASWRIPPSRPCWPLALNTVMTIILLPQAPALTALLTQ